MNFLEKDLEDIIYCVDNSALYDRGLNVKGIKRRQVRIGKYGVADLLTVHRSLDEIIITVYELKKGPVTVSAFCQAVRYATGILEYLQDHRNPKLNNSYSVDIKVIGDSIDTTQDFVFIPSAFFGIEFITYSYNWDGIRFKKNRFKKVDSFL